LSYRYEHKHFSLNNSGLILAKDKSEEGMEKKLKKKGGKGGEGSF